jgi:hypothetical protein
MLNGMLILWFVLTGLSLLYITYDLVMVTPEATVMKWGWWLVTLYAGPVGLFWYLLSCKEPMPGAHEEFVAPHWKQALGSMVHCLAGDITGIILAALILAFFTVSMPVEIVIEYLAGFGFGLFIFQSLFMKDMIGGTYGKAVKSSFYPEFTSMNMIMAGMIPTMVIWSLLEPSSRSPTSLHFWGKMSLATIIAGISAYPINSWLVKKRLKHGMMTMRSKSENVMHDHMGHKAIGHEQTHHEAALQVTAHEMWQKCVFSLIGLAVGILISLAAWYALR